MTFPSDFQAQNSHHRFYTDLAWLYDKISPKIFDYEELFSDISRFLEQTQCKNILEVGCGTGRLMTVMERNGYNVTGLDINQEMLDIAKTRCSGKLIRQDMREICIHESFDAVVCLGRTFGYMITNEDANRALKCFHKVLRDGGTLIMDSFDAESSRKYSHEREKWTESSFEFEDMKIIRRTKISDYEESNNTWLVDWDFIIDNGDRNVVSDRARLRSFDKIELEELLSCIGFKVAEYIQWGQITLVANRVTTGRT